MGFAAITVVVIWAALNNTVYSILGQRLGIDSHALYMIGQRIGLIAVVGGFALSIVAAIWGRWHRVPALALIAFFPYFVLRILTVLWEKM